MSGPLSRLIVGREPQIGEQNLGTLGGESLGDSGADALVGTCYQCDAPREARIDHRLILPGPFISPVA
jgi:hypothetical protein